MNGALTESYCRSRIRLCNNAYHGRVGEETGWLILQHDHQSETNDSEGERKVWLCWELDDASLQELVPWAHLRWTIKRFHQDIRQILGADEFQGRTWRRFHHHMAVILLTQAFVAEQRLDTWTEYGGCDRVSYEFLPPDPVYFRRNTVTCRVHFQTASKFLVTDLMIRLKQ